MCCSSRPVLLEQQNVDLLGYGAGDTVYKLCCHMLSLQPQQNKIGMGALAQLLVYWLRRDRCQHSLRREYTMAWKQICDRGRRASKPQTRESNLTALGPQTTSLWKQTKPIDHGRHQARNLWTRSLHW